MSFQELDGAFHLYFNLVSTTTLAGIMLLFGYFIRKKIYFFDKYCFPAPVIGGFLFAVVAFLLKNYEIAEIHLDATLKAPFMLAFFTTVGLGGSASLLKKGGKAMIIYLVACWSLAFIQNGFGVFLANRLGIHPALGIMAGAVSLEGGHGNAAVFGPLAENLGVQSAEIVAVASATFGLIAGSLLGGPVARFLIQRHRLPIETDTSYQISYDELVEQAQKDMTIDPKGTMTHMTLIGVMMVIGMFITNFLSSEKYTIPDYVGCMFVAIIFRNLNDHFHFMKINEKVIDLISEISLGFFLSIAMMELRIWQLLDLIGPLVIILVLQVILLIALCIFLLFPILGKNYDAAVMVGGMMGHGLGATPNAVANMQALSEHYKLKSEKAFLIVPLCGAVLVDLVSIPCILWFINQYA